MRNLTKEEVKFSTFLELEHCRVRGNYMCTDDPEADAKAEDEILERLENNDFSAWCTLTVKAEWDDYEGYAYLGCCSFAPDLLGSRLEKEIETMAEDHGMYDEALEDLNKSVKNYISDAKVLEAKLT